MESSKLERSFANLALERGHERGKEKEEGGRRKTSSSNQAMRWTPAIAFMAASRWASTVSLII